MTAKQTFAEFKAQALAAGFDEVVVRRFPPHTHNIPHQHPFDAFVCVAYGELWLSQKGEIAHFKMGDAFNVEGNTVHEERYGSQGAIIWVARRLCVVSH
jgi:quercetin dioxygenase-like cupin family protein